MAIDYDAGRGRRGAYQNLADALQSKLDAQNRREAEDIRRKGLFGTGITQDNLTSLAQTGLSVANFGDQRRKEQMDQATSSFDRRMAQMQKRYQFYKDRADKGGTADDQAMARGLMEAMSAERNKFENAMGEYSGKGMFGTSFGGDAVGYKGADVQASEKKLLDQIMANRMEAEKREEKTPGPVTNQFGEQGRGTGYGPLPGGGMMGGVTTPVQNFRDNDAGRRFLRRPELPDSTDPKPQSGQEFTSFDNMLSPREKAKRRNAMFDTTGVLNNYSLGSGYQA